MAIVEIQLTLGKIAIIDAADYEIAAKYKWHATVRDSKWYAASSAERRSTGRCLYLHREILSAPADMQVDHENGDGLDCRRSNLRICTQSDNQRNMISVRGDSGFRGVSKVIGNKTRTWNAYIWVGNKKKSLGNYDKKEEAARAYNAAAVEYHGNFARLNLIQGLTYAEAITPPERNRTHGRRKQLQGAGSNELPS